MKTIKIFLASSEELAPEREKMTDLIYQLNKLFKGRGLELDLEKWEYLDSSMGSTRKQDEYNEVLKDCEMCLTIFWRRFGVFTGEEFDTAYQQMASGQNPKKIYVFFKTADAKQISPELKSFKESILTRYGHFLCKFDNVDTMKLEFLLQLENYQKNLLGENAIDVRQEHVYVGDEVVADLNNIPFAANNEGFKKMQSELKELKEEITGLQEELEKKQQRLEKKKAKMEEHPDDEDYKEEYEEVKEEMEKLIEKLQPKLNKYNKLKEDFEREQQNLFNTARRIVELRGTRISERMARAIDAFENGDAQRADAILDEAEHDADEALADIRMAKEVGLKSLEELILKASVKMANDTIPIDERVEETLKIYEKADALAQAIGYEEKRYKDFLGKYSFFLLYYAKTEKAIEILKRKAVLAETIDKHGHSPKAILFIEIGRLYNEIGDHPMAAEYYHKAVSIFENNLILDDGNDDSPIKLEKLYGDLGYAYSSLEDFPKALDYYLKALEKNEKRTSSASPSLYRTIGWTYYRLGNLPALDYYHKAIETKRPSPIIAFCYRDLGLIFDEMGDHSKALDYYFKTLAFYGKRSTYDLCKALLLSNIGSAYCGLNDYSTVLDYYNKSLSIYEKVYPEDHPDITNVKKRIEELKLSKNE